MPNVETVATYVLVLTLFGVTASFGYPGGLVAVFADFVGMLSH